MLNEILEAKEQRHAIRKNFSEEGYATISMNFNIPGYPKSDYFIKEAFFQVKTELQNYLIASRIKVIDREVTIRHDEAGDICFFPIHGNGDLISVKDDLERFEENHYFGRLIDVDLFNTNLNPISSGKKKACILCKDKPAIECMREKNHSYEELRAHIKIHIQKYLEQKNKSNICNRLSSLAMQSILMEVSLPGKPGLVCPGSQGSHTDMNYQDFLASTAAISPYFMELAQMGYEWDGIRNKNILQKLRVIGIEMEQSMFRATQGINTQKGIIFLMGFSLFAAAHVIRIGKNFDVDLFRGVIKLLNQGIVGSELENGWNKNISHGEQCFNKYGKEFAGGIRQEIEAGFPTVFEIALPFMQEIFPSGIDTINQGRFQEKLLHVLIKIMSANNDTNILHRADIDVLNEMKAIASLLEKTEGNITESIFYNDLLNFCKMQNISPGGSADLLAITIFVYQVNSKWQMKSCKEF